MVIKYVLNKIKTDIHLIPIHETFYLTMCISVNPWNTILDHYITLVCQIRSIQYQADIKKSTRRALITKKTFDIFSNQSLNIMF